MNHEMITTQAQRAIIPSKDITMLTQANELVDKYMPGWNYVIPELNNPKVKYLAGISGGVDSAALAAVLLVKHPELYGRITLLFSDTGNEPDSCYEILDRLEKIFGVEIVRLKEKTLFGQIEENGGFLPSVKSRWCTSVLKIKPWNKYLKKYLLTGENTKVIAFSGLRWDERDRMGLYGIDRVVAHFPFIDQKIERAAVCSLATELELMNNAYMQGRSRSGCQNCFFSSKQELISLLVWSPKSFAEGQKKEKVSSVILDRFSQDKDMNLKPSGFYTPYPMPNLITEGKDSFSEATLFGIERFDKEGTVSWDYRTAPAGKVKRTMKRYDESQNNLFEEEDADIPVSDNNGAKSVITEEECVLYVGIENYKHELLAMFGNGDELCGVWNQRLITYSRSLGGLSRSLSGYHYHRQMAARGWFQTEQDYNNQSHITVLEIKFPQGTIPRIEYDSCYTWTSNRSYAEIAYIVRCIDRAAELHVSKKLIKEKRRTILTESAESFIDAWDKDGCPDLGQITGIGHYRPKPVEESQFDSYEEDAKTIRCSICSI